MRCKPTTLLRGAVIVFGLVILAICVLVLPVGILTDETDYYRPILIGLYVPAIPYFFALYQAMKLLHYIDHNKAFSELSVAALNKIKYCATVILVLFGAGMPYIYYAADRDDAPGVVAIGLIIIFATTIIAAFASLLQKLLQNAVAIQSENDLTV